MKILFKNTVYVFLLVLLFSNCQSTVPITKTNIVETNVMDNQTNTQLKAIEKLIQERVVENDIPALSVGIIKNNKTIAYFNIGTTKRNNQQQVDENTVYQLASLSKTFTSVIAKELVAEGKIDLNASITNYLPTTLSKATLQKLSPITIKNLLTHTAGFPRDAQYAKRPWQFLDGPMVGGYSEKSLLKELEELTLIAKPNEKWEYSNLGFGTTGYILERTAGIPLADLYEQFLGQKYGMKRTTMDLEKAEKLGMATPYMKWWRKKKTSPWEMGYLRSGGGLCSTVSDLCGFMEQQIQAYQQSDNNTENSPITLLEDKVSLGESGYPYYGYGTFEFRKMKDSTIVQLGHGGDVDGFASNYTFYPNQGIGIVMLTSSGGSWFYHLEGAFQRILLELKPRKEVEVAKEVIAQYLGQYELNHGQIISILMDEGVLKAEFPNIGRKEIAPYATNKFFLKDFDGELIFTENQLRFADNVGNHHLGKKVQSLLSNN